MSTYAKTVHWSTIFNFLSNVTYAIKQILSVHEFMCLSVNALQEVEQHMMMFIHYYNINNDSSGVKEENMNAQVINYVQNEIYKSISKLYHMGLRDQFLSHLLFILNCLWDEQPYNNPKFTINYMYMNDKIVTVDVSSRNVTCWTRLLWGHIYEFYYYVLTDGQRWDRWLIFVQKCNICRQLAQYMADHIETKLKQLLAQQDNIKTQKNDTDCVDEDILDVD